MCEYQVKMTRLIEYTFKILLFICMKKRGSNAVPSKICKPLTCIKRLRRNQI